MLKQILNEKIKEQDSLQSAAAVLESKKSIVELDNDPEIEMVLPMFGAGEEEFGDYRFILKQLKKRNPKAFKKIVNLD